MQLDDDEISLPEEYLEFKLIRYMGWDWHTYKAQPDLFIHQCLAFMDAEVAGQQKRGK